MGVVARLAAMRVGVVEKWVGHFIIEAPYFTGRQAGNSAGRQVVLVAETSQVEVSALLADIGHIEQHLAWKFLLESEAPGLLIRNALADFLDGSDRIEPDVVERAVIAAWSRRDPAISRCGKRTGSVFERVVWSGVVDIEGSDPGRLNVEALVAPRASPGRAAARC